MSNFVWEDNIALNSTAELQTQVLTPVATHIALNDHSVVWDESKISLNEAAQRDESPLPLEQDREGYYGANHFNYWASGLRDWLQILEWLDKQNITVRSALDIGCASGRLIRHWQAQTDIQQVIGCDINRLHVDWVSRYLPGSIQVFQNSSLPTLPLADESLDLVTAFSVFTHVESFDTTWLMELRRILRPGGIAWLTVHSDRTWQDLAPDWPLYQALHKHPEFKALRSQTKLTQDRTIMRWHKESSYSANVFYRESYLRQVWGRVLKFEDMVPGLPNYQDIVVLRKT
ncbi:class I SAM-dependent methyltransferase [Acidithiobacillus sp. MC6.1]|nr:class I SAM-dependent methyltransferase [Acidithiobacillus sp. MC6.1]